MDWLIRLLDWLTLPEVSGVIERPKMGEDVVRLFSDNLGKYTTAVFVTTCTHEELKEVVRDKGILVCSDYTVGDVRASSVRGLGKTLQDFASKSLFVRWVETIPKLR